MCRHVDEVEDILPFSFGREYQLNVSFSIVRKIRIVVVVLGIEFFQINYIGKKIAVFSVGVHTGRPAAEYQKQHDHRHESSHICGG
jgi:hypothetical protein